MDLSTLLDLHDMERAAQSVLDEPTWAYVRGGAGTESGIHDNLSAFTAFWLRPRILSEAPSRPRTDVSLFGCDLALPVLLAPTSPIRLVHPEAELAVAKAAAASGVASIVSTDGHYPFADVAQVAPDTCWFQLYAYEDRSVVERTVAMAQRAGARAMVLTVDACYPAQRLSAQRARFQTPADVDLGTLRELGVLQGQVPSQGRLARMAMTWRDLSWLREQTQVPLLVKGVLHPEDARRLIDAGADGLIVSNHGGRQLDGVIPSLMALRDIREAVRGQVPVLVDGGIRSGTDIVKALALGARAVCLGRPYLWGLAIGGSAGVAAVISILHRQLEDVLRQLGLASVSDVTPDCVIEVARRPS